MKIFNALMIVLVFVFPIDAKLDGKFGVNRGGNEPLRPFTTMKLLQNLLCKDKLTNQASIIQKTRNKELRDLVAKLIQSDTSTMTNKNQQRRARRNKMKRFRNYHKKKPT